MQSVLPPLSILNTWGWKLANIRTFTDKKYVKKNDNKWNTESKVLSQSILT